MGGPAEDQIEGKDAMTVRRGPLYLGVFLLAAGAVTLLVVTGVVDPAAVANAMIVLWPLAIIAIGVGLVLRRSPAALPAGIVAAMLPGLALGASMAAIPAIPAGMPMPCTDGSAPVRQADTRSGPLGPAAVVDLTLSCGEIRVTTQPGTNWRFDAREGNNRTTNLTSYADRLVASTDDRLRAWQPSTGRVDWDVVLPTGPAIDFTTTVNAGRAQLDLAGARLGSASLEANAGALEVDLTGATLDQLDVEVNAGSAAVTLPAPPSRVISGPMPVRSRSASRATWGFASGRLPNWGRPRSMGSSAPVTHGRRPTTPPPRPRPTSCSTPASAASRSTPWEDASEPPSPLPQP